MSSSRCPGTRTRSRRQLPRFATAAGSCFSARRGAQRMPSISLRLRRKRVRLVGAHVSTLTRTRGGSGWVDAAERYLADVAAGRLDPDRLVTDKIEPDEAATLYRRLGRGDAVVGVLIDWSALPAEERAAPSSAFSLPSVGAAGADPVTGAATQPHAPLAGGRRSVRRGTRAASIRAHRLRRRGRPKRRCAAARPEHEPCRLLRYRAGSRRGSRADPRHRRVRLIRRASRSPRHRRRLSRGAASSTRAARDSRPSPPGSTSSSRSRRRTTSAARSSSGMLRQAAGLALSYCFPQRYGGSGSRSQAADRVRCARRAARHAHLLFRRQDRPLLERWVQRPFQVGMASLARAGRWRRPDHERLAPCRSRALSRRRRGRVGPRRRRPRSTATRRSRTRYPSRSRTRTVRSARCTPRLRVAGWAAAAPRSNSGEVRDRSCMQDDLRLYSERRVGDLRPGRWHVIEPPPR